MSNTVKQFDRRTWTPFSASSARTLTDQEAESKRVHAAVPNSAFSPMEKSSARGSIYALMGCITEYMSVSRAAERCALYVLGTRRAYVWFDRTPTAFADGQTDAPQCFALLHIAWHCKKLFWVYAYDTNDVAARPFQPATLNPKP